MYVAEQLWLSNAVLHKEWKYPHFLEMIDGKYTKDAQHESDERERQMVHDWLMGGG